MNKSVSLYSMRHKILLPSLLVVLMLTGCSADKSENYEYRFAPARKVDLTGIRIGEVDITKKYNAIAKSVAADLYAFPNPNNLPEDQLTDENKILTGIVRRATIVQQLNDKTFGFRVIIDFVFNMDGKSIKSKGTYLNLTATIPQLKSHIQSPNLKWVQDAKKNSRVWTNDVINQARELNYQHSHLFNEGLKRKLEEVYEDMMDRFPKQSLEIAEDWDKLIFDANLEEFNPKKFQILNDLLVKIKLPAAE